MGRISKEKEAEIRGKALAFLTECYQYKQAIPSGHEYPIQLTYSHRSSYYVLLPFSNYSGSDYFDGIESRDEAVLFNLRLMWAQGYRSNSGPIKAYLVGTGVVATVQHKGKR